MQTHTKPFLPFLVSLFIFLLFNISAKAQELWGMTKYGGEYEKGVIFKMDENASNQEVVFSFETVQNPEGGLTEYENGDFYGLSSGGGKYHFGVIYRFELEEGRFTKILDFDGEEMGKEAIDRMIYASNGKMYGTTLYGGVHDKGVLFEFDPQTESFKKIMDFDGQDKGAEPMGTLLEGIDGKLYGTTASGGTNDDGVLFSYDLSANVFAKVFDFEGIVSGAMPVGSLIQKSDGIIYGMTKWGGANDDGVIFRYEPELSQFTIVLEFNGTATGRNPVAGLTETSNGKLYGLTPYGGNSDVGVLFEYNPLENIFTKKIDFPDGGTGFYPQSILMAAKNDKLYGLVEPGLDYGDWLFEYDPENNTYFRSEPMSFPRASSVFLKSLIQASNNKLYFIVNSLRNDDRNENNLYEYDPSTNQFTNHFRFSGIETGEWPHGSLHQGSNGMLYGTTYIGGAYHKGVIFKIDPETYDFTKMVDFEGDSKGAKPHGGVIQADNHKLYGMTSEGGVHDKGVIYEVDLVSESFTRLFDFNGLNGEYPSGEFAKGTNGMLYGVTATGGAYGNGVLFEFNPLTGFFTKVVDFDGTQLGEKPNSYALVAASDGNIYGTTLLGGLSEEGVMFEYNPAIASFQKVIDFQQAVTGRVPENLVQGNDGMLYGHVAPGFIVKIDPSSSQIAKVLDDSYIFNPIAGKLLQASNGKFYGMDRGLIWYRATDFFGGIHEFDVAGGTYNLIMEFSWTNGSNPENSSLIQLKSLALPVAQCKSTTVYLDENGQAILQPADIDDGSTGVGIELSHSKSDFTCEDAGENNVILTATDENGNTTTCTAVVTVADTIAPEALCRNIEVFLDATGNAEIEAQDVDDGSSDACGIESMTLDVTTFTCENAGENLVELTVTDINGNTSSCMATVTVKDSIALGAVCKDIEISLDASGMAGIEVNDIDNGSDDACGIASITINKTSFTCEDVGENAVELTVTDNNGNSSSCTAMVTVTDNQAPDISCTSGLSRYLEPYEEIYSIEGTELDAVATDNCLIESMEYIINGDGDKNGTSLAGFGLEAGVHEIAWLAADAGGNETSCLTIITIEKRPTTLMILENEIDLEQKVIHVEARLMDDLLVQGIEGKALVFTTDDASVTAVTNENGVANVSIPVEDEPSGIFSLEASFDEDAAYAGAQAESEIVTGTGDILGSAVKVYPNPFTERLYIEFTAMESADARIDLFDAAGRLIKNIFNQPVTAGNFYKVEYSPPIESSSFFLYRMKIGTTVLNGKIVYGK